MIVSYVFLFFFFWGLYEVCNTLHDIHRTLEEIDSQMDDHSSRIWRSLNDIHGTLEEIASQMRSGPS